METATLIAALIAASASLLKLFADRQSEDRGAYRRQLEPVVKDLGQAVYEVVAISFVLREARPGQVQAWCDRAEQAKAKLTKVRPRARYPLWGLDEGLRTLERLPGWMMHVREQPQRASRLIAAANDLRKMLDVTVLRCYRWGRSPSLMERAQVRLHSWRCRRQFEKPSPENYPGLG